MQSHTIAVVGAGLIGCSWAIVFARAGLDVAIYDADPAVRDAAAGRLANSLRGLAEVGLLSSAPDEVAARIKVCSDLASTVAPADYIQESVFERLDTKALISAQIDKVMQPTATVGSSSSGIPASRFTADLSHRDRFLIVHPVNPPHLIPVVELVPAPWTDRSALSFTRALMEQVRQSPVTVEREIDGFVLNRLQGALLNEAWALYREGYATLEDIDRTVRDGLGLRWSFMGPFETIDLNAPGGIEDYARRLGGLYHQVAMDRTSPEPWDDELIGRVTEERRRQLPMSDLYSRSVWRDARLMRLMALRNAK